MELKSSQDPLTNRERTHFAARLHNWRTGRGLFLKQVTAEFSVADATWSRWEKQERFPFPANLRLLAEFIGVPTCCYFYPDPASCPNCSCRPKSPTNPPL